MGFIKRNSTLNMLIKKIKRRLNMKTPLSFILINNKRCFFIFDFISNQHLTFSRTLIKRCLLECWNQGHKNKY